MISRALVLLRRGCGLSIGLLLLILLEPLIAPPKSTCQSAHRRASSGTLPRVARYRTANRSKRGATPRASYDMTLRRQRLVLCGCVRGNCLGPAWIESGLFNRP